MTEALNLDPSPDDPFAPFRAALLRACTEGAVDVQVDHRGAMRILKLGTWIDLDMLPLELLPKIQRLLCFGPATNVSRGTLNLMNAGRLIARCHVIFIPTGGGEPGHLSIRLTHCNASSATLNDPIFSANASALLGKAFLKQNTIVVISSNDHIARTAALRKLIDAAPAEMVHRACALSINEDLVRTLLDDGVLAIHVDPARGTNISGSLNKVQRLLPPLVVVDPLDDKAVLPQLAELAQTETLVVITSKLQADFLTQVRNVLPRTCTLLEMTQEPNGLWGCRTH